MLLYCSGDGTDGGGGGGGVSSSEGQQEEGATGLRALSQLRCLYLQNNLLARVGDGLRGLTALVTLDLRCVALWVK